MRKKVLSLITAIAVAACLFGNFAASAQSGYYTQVPGGTRYGYNWLANPANTGANSAALASLYNSLVAYAEAAYTSQSYLYDAQYGMYYAGEMDIEKLGLPYNQSSKDLIDLAINCFMDDNPQYYMLGNSYYTSYTSYNRGGSTLITSLEINIPNEYAPLAERQRINAIIEKKFAEYQSLTATVASDFDKARLVHDKILAERDYSYYMGKPDDRVSAHNIVGVLDISTGGPVCESYAEAFQYIMNRLGIETLTVSGKGTDDYGNVQDHAWNMVKAGGKWYYADITWDDWETVGKANGEFNDPGNLKNALFYRYFMVGSGNYNFAVSHSPRSSSGSNGYALPEASATDYDTMNGSSYKWLNDNGWVNLNKSYGPDYNYYIGYTDNAGYPNSAPDALFLNAGGGRYSWNGWRSHYFGSYTVEQGATSVPVTANLYKWSFNSSKSGFNEQFTNPLTLVQGVDYDIVVEQPIHEGQNRAYVYGKGAYRGVDFGIIDVKFTAPVTAPVTETKTYTFAMAVAALKISMRSGTLATAEEKEKYDYNKDGAVNFTDAVAILKAAL